MYATQKIKDKLMTKINKDLLIEQKVTPEQIKNLERLYLLLEDMFIVAKKLQKSNSLNYSTGSIISNTIRDIEFLLQKNWNFKQDSTKHTFQLKLPNCLCPKLDNENSFGSSYLWVNQECPYHGNKNN